MKVLSKLLILLAALFFVISCSKDPQSNTPSNNEDNIEDVYFVKYVCDRAYGTARYTNEEGKSVTSPTVYSGGSFERTIGPVAKGFKSSVTVDRGTGVRDLPVRIEVKRNNEPFVVKIEGICSVSYVIE